MKSNSPKIQNLISSIYSFFLSLLLLALTVIIGLYFGVFNNRIIVSKVNESNYYNEVLKEVNDRAEIIISKTGLNSSVLNEVITLEKIYISGKYYIEDTLSGKDHVINTASIRDRLTQNIDQYLIEQEIERTEELDKGVNEIVSAVEQEYKRGVRFQFVQFVTEYKLQYVEFIQWALPILILFIALISYLLIRIQKYKHRGIRYITYAVMSSSLMTVLTATYLLLLRFYDKVEVSPQYYNRFLANYLRWDIQVYIYLGGIGAVISALLIMYVGYLKNRRVLR